MLEKLGIIASLNKWTIQVSGPIMLNKWMEEIGSNNPKNIERLERARSIADSTRPCGGFNPGSNPGVPAQ